MTMNDWESSRYQFWKERKNENQISGASYRVEKRQGKERARNDVSVGRYGMGVGEPICSSVLILNEEKASLLRAAY